MFTHACHCKNCQTQTGGPFALNAILETDSLKLISGDLQPFKMATGSGLGQTVFRCSNCYVATWGHYAAAGNGFVYIRVGTLDDPSICQADVHLFTKSKLAWLTLPNDAPAFEEMYDREKYWPPEALMRRERVIEAKN
tara:strand:+ start:460 stop:873 length:414 start_codon:yes stop_codon:yes gene_type:complete